MTAFALPNMAHTVAQWQNQNNPAAGRFSAARAAADQRGFGAVVLRRTRTLRTLAQDHPQRQSRHYAGRQSVWLDDIRSSEG
jgi:hypothetical protein